MFLGTPRQSIISLLRFLFVPPGFRMILKNNKYDRWLLFPWLFFFSKPFFPHSKPPFLASHNTKRPPLPTASQELLFSALKTTWRRSSSFAASLAVRWAFGLAFGWVTSSRLAFFSCICPGVSFCFAVFVWVKDHASNIVAFLKKMLLVIRKEAVFETSWKMLGDRGVALREKVAKPTKKVFFCEKLWMYPVSLMVAILCSYFGPVYYVLFALMLCFARVFLDSFFLKASKNFCQLQMSCHPMSSKYWVKTRYEPQIRSEKNDEKETTKQTMIFRSPIFGF